MKMRSDKTREWINKQQKVYANEGFDEPDRLIRNLPNKTESRFEALINTVENTKRPMVTMLEAGSASGAISFYIAEKYENVHIDTVDLPNVIKKITKKHPRVNLIPMDLNKKFPPYAYDIIYATGVIEHIYDDWRFITNCYKCLKKNGTLIITAPMSVNMFGQPDSLHIRVYPKDMLDNLLKLAGFWIERSWEENERKRIIATRKG